MDELLKMFVVIYLKCSQAVQLTFVNDIDLCMHMIKEKTDKLFVENSFVYKVLLSGIHQFKHCMKQKLQDPAQNDCEYLKLSSIKKRCKRNESQLEGGSIGSKEKRSIHAACTIHGRINLDECIIDLDTPNRFI